MRICWPLAIVIAVVIANSASSARAEKLLAEAARPFALKLKNGGIVTAQLDGERVLYAVAGNPPLTNVPSERIVFEIGSISKVFTGLLLAQAIVEHKVTAGTTLREILGKDQAFADPRVGAITLRQLATHTSGLPRIPDDLSEPNSDDPYAHYDRVRLMAYLARVRLKDGTAFAWDYSNLGVGLLGDILARVYGRSWEELVREKITGPLGMKDTVVSLNPDQSARFAPPYAGATMVKPWNFQALAGAGSLRSTAADMIVFGKAFLAPQSTRLKEAIALVVTPQTADGGFGLGIELPKIDGHRIYMHNGSTAGYESVLAIDPERRTVRVVLANNGDAPVGECLTAMRQDRQFTVADAVPVAPEQLADYEGVFQLTLNRQSCFTVLRREGQLWVRLKGQPFFRVYAKGKDRFFYTDVPAELQFSRTNGQVMAVTLLQNGAEIPADRTGGPPAVLLPSAAELAEYTGTYALAPGQEFSVKVTDATLYARLTGQPFCPVFETRRDYFEYDIVEAALEFERDGAGKIIGLKLHQNGNILPAPKK